MGKQTEKKHFCYLLRSLNPKYSNSTYIGYTVNPKRRIRQHNREIMNGAVKTHRAMPWEMIVVVYGFPSKTDGLSFEWAWQHPSKSRICRNFISQTLERRRKYTSKIEIALYMLSHSPWCTMDLSMIVTNYHIFNEIKQSYGHFFTVVRIQNQPLQFLYDSFVIDESKSENENSVSIINSHFDESKQMYIANQYCSNFRYVKCNI